MNTVYEVVLDSATCAPGGSVSGRVAWKRVEPPREVEIRLFWQVVGGGVDDAYVADSREIPSTSTEDEERFEFQLPGKPYTYEGTLFSIKWGVELLVDGRASVAYFSMR